MWHVNCRCWQTASSDQWTDIVSIRDSKKIVFEILWIGMCNVWITVNLLTRKHWHRNFRSELGHLLWQIHLSATICGAKYCIQCTGFIIICYKNNNKIEEKKHSINHKFFYFINLMLQYDCVCIFIYIKLFMSLIWSTIESPNNNSCPDDNKREILFFVSTRHQNMICYLNESEQVCLNFEVFAHLTLSSWMWPWPYGFTWPNI